MKSLRFLSVVLLVVLLASMLSGCAGGGSAGNFPTKPVNLIVHAGAGGGSDIMARSLASTIEKGKFLPQPIVVENKAGGSGAIAMAYVAEKKADPYYLLTAVTSFLTTPIMSPETGVDYKNFTPIANFGYDHYVLMVSSDGPFKTVKDVVDAAKAKPKEVTVGGTQMGSSDTICAYLLEKNQNIKFNYITFKSGGEVNAALLGNHINFAISNPGEALELWKAGKVKLLGVYAEKRLKAMPDVPTMKEQGYDVQYVQNRGLVAPSGIPDTAVKAYEAAFKKAYDSDAWKAYMKENMIEDGWMGSADFGKWLAGESVRYQTILKEMGVVK